MMELYATLSLFLAVSLSAGGELCDKKGFQAVWACRGRACTSCWCSDVLTFDSQPLRVREHRIVFNNEDGKNFCGISPTGN